MPQYQIDEMVGDTLAASHVAFAEAPLDALQKITGCPVSPRALHHRWLRVVDKT